MIEAFPAASLVDIQLETGRTHQIRVHFSALRHPCVGDTDLRRRPDAGRPARRRSGSGCTPSGSASRTRPTAAGWSSPASTRPTSPARWPCCAPRPELRGASRAGLNRGLPGSLADFGPAALAAVVVAGYLVVGEPVVGHVLHRRFEGRLRTDPGARRSFYRRLLVLEWGLALLALVVWLAAPGVDAGAGRACAGPQQWPGPVTGAGRRCSCWCSSLVSTRALRGGALLEARRSRSPPAGGGPARRAAGARHARAAARARPGERRLFTVVGVTAGVCEEWLYRGFFLAVVAALAGGLPTAALVARRRGGLRSGARLPGAGRASSPPACSAACMAALYLQTGSLLLPVLLHAAIDLRFLLVPAARAARRPGGRVSAPDRVGRRRRRTGRRSPRCAPGSSWRSRACRRRSSRTTPTPTAVHVLSRDDAGRVVATGRLLVDGEHRRRSAGWPPTRPSAGGATAPPSSPSCTARRSLRGVTEIELHAQVTARGFYERAGYTAVGEEYEEAGIAHVTMRRGSLSPRGRCDGSVRL